MTQKSLGDRMKEYENVTSHFLAYKLPVIIRLGIKDPHSFIKDFKPFDDIFVSAMQNTMLELCERAEGCVMGYTHSEEITLILCDYVWFGHGVNKMRSISASIATSAFNKYFRNAAIGVSEVYEKRIDKANFDSRVFNLPKEEVCNYMIWRQQDAVRNSIQATSQAHFSHKQLRDTCCIKMPILINEGQTDEVLRNKWTIDEEIPVFSDDRDYVEKRIIFEEEP